MVGASSEESLYRVACVWCEGKAVMGELRVRMVLLYVRHTSLNGMAIVFRVRLVIAAT